MEAKDSMEAKDLMEIRVVSVDKEVSAEGKVALMEDSMVKDLMEGKVVLMETRDKTITKVVSEEAIIKAAWIHMQSKSQHTM